MATATAIPQPERAPLSVGSIPETAFTKARELLPLLKMPGETAESIRGSIGAGDCSDPALRKYRHEVLIAFDALQIVRGQPAEITPELRAAILRLLKLNWSQERVAKALHVGLVIVKRVAEAAKASTWKRGRGRRFTHQEWEAMVALVKSKQRSSNIQRQFHCDWHTVAKIRRLLGDTENRRHWKRLSPEQIAQAETLLKDGRQRWRDVAAALKVSPTTLLHWCRFRKRVAFRYFAPAEVQEVLASIKRGEGPRPIAKRMGRPRSSIGLLMRRLRAQDSSLPQRSGLLPKQMAAICKARSKGHSYAAIGRQFNLSGGGVRKIIKRGTA